MGLLGVFLSHSSEQVVFPDAILLCVQVRHLGCRVLRPLSGEERDSHMIGKP